MIIGIDFDNTIVCYDGVFYRVALERGLIPAETPKNKGAVRDFLRSIDRGDDWTEMQGYVYGARMNDAEAFPGALEFIRKCVEKDISVYIISHKTRHPYMGELYDLHQAAKDWLEFVSLYDPAVIGMKRENVFYELTKMEKLERIGKTSCTHFIDDLPEFLSEPEFPSGVTKLLFDPGCNCVDGSPFFRAAAWSDIDGFFFSDSTGTGI